MQTEDLNADPPGPSPRCPFPRLNHVLWAGQVWGEPGHTGESLLMPGSKPEFHAPHGGAALLKATSSFGKGASGLGKPSEPLPLAGASLKTLEAPGMFQNYGLPEPPNYPSHRGCCCLVTKSCLTLMTLLTVAHQAPLSMGFPRKEYWNGLLFPSPGYLPIPGIEPTSLATSALAGGFFTTEPPEKSIPILQLRKLRLGEASYPREAHWLIGDVQLGSVSECCFGDRGPGSLYS